ncbi:MAG: hypothetical protein H0V09_10965 [Gemmatimonadetes bacterium]|nr:hypothetical protein [Gemmatimonadota bacterium]
MDERHWLPQVHSDEEALPDLLERLADRWVGRLVLPTNDHALATLARHHDRLARAYPPVVPPWEVTGPLLVKDRLYAVAERLGIDVPRSYGPATRRSAEAPDIAFPVLVKPVESHLFHERFRRKLFVAADRGELLEAVDRVVAAGIMAEILDLIPGPDSACHNYTVYLDARAEPLAEFPFRKLRKSPPFYGVARVAETTGKLDLRERTLDLLRALGWRGIASAEYKLDPRDGRYRLMDVNARCYLAHALALRCGVNYPLLAWREHVAGAPLRMRPNDWRGVWIHEQSDILYMLRFHGREGLGVADYVAPYRRPKTFAVWSRQDPRPALVEWAAAFATARRMLRSAAEREEVRQRVQPGFPEA